MASESHILTDTVIEELIYVGENCSLDRFSCMTASEWPSHRRPDWSSASHSIAVGRAKPSPAVPTPLYASSSSVSVESHFTVMRCLKSVPDTE